MSRVWGKSNKSIFYDSQVFLCLVSLNFNYFAKFQSFSKSQESRGKMKKRTIRNFFHVWRKWKSMVCLKGLPKQILEKFQSFSKSWIFSMSVGSGGQWCVRAGVQCPTGWTRWRDCLAKSSHLFSFATHRLFCTNTDRNREIQVQIQIYIDWIHISWTRWRDCLAKSSHLFSFATHRLFCANTDKYG